MLAAYDYITVYDRVTLVMEYTAVCEVAYTRSQIL